MKKLMVGNWKMNGVATSLLEAQMIAAGAPDGAVRVAVGAVWRSGARRGTQRGAAARRPLPRRSALLLLPLLREPRIPCSNQPVPLVHVGGLGFAVKGVLHHSLQVAGGEAGRGQRTTA